MTEKKKHGRVIRNYNATTQETYFVELFRPLFTVHEQQRANKMASAIVATVVARCSMQTSVCERLPISDRVTVANSCKADI